MSNETDLTDGQWRCIEPLLPAKAATGRPRADDRRTINGILYVLKTGCRWKDLPARYGAHVTAWRRLQRWSADGTWERIWRTLLAELDKREKLDWERCAPDGSYVRAKGAAMR